MTQVTIDRGRYIEMGESTGRIPNFYAEGDDLITYYKEVDNDNTQ